MKFSLLSATALLAAVATSVQGFAPPSPVALNKVSSSALFAKYNTMEEVLALFPDDRNILINFYDANTENDIKADIQRAKQLLDGRARVVSMKQQDYPEIAKMWDCDQKSPSMILFKDGTPATRLYEETHYLEIVARIGKFCNSD
jgi:hypothetical protein